MTEDRRIQPPTTWWPSFKLLTTLSSGLRSCCTRTRTDTEHTLLILCQPHSHTHTGEHNRKTVSAAATPGRLTRWKCECSSVEFSLQLCSVLLRGMCVCYRHPLPSHDVNHSSKANHGEHMTLLFHLVLSDLCDLLLCVSLQRSSSIGSKPQLCGVVATVD